MKTKAEKLQFDMNCYGHSRETLIEALTPQAEAMGRDMLIMSMLSDAQQFIEMGDKEEARKLINRTKWVLTRLPLNEMDEFLQSRRDA